MNSYDNAKELNIHFQRVLGHLEGNGLQKEVNAYVLCESTQNKSLDCVPIYEILQKCNEIKPLLKQLIRADKIQITYNNTGQIKPRCTPPFVSRLRQTAKKVML